MTKYLVLYTSTAGAEERIQQSAEEAAAEMQAWMAWAGSLDDSLIDFGLPLGNGRVVTAEGARRAASTVSGYSLVRAPDVDAAVALMKDHPHLKNGGIEVHESFEIPGM